MTTGTPPRLTTLGGALGVYLAGQEEGDMGGLDDVVYVVAKAPFRVMADNPILPAVPAILLVVAFVVLQARRP